MHILQPKHIKLKSDEARKLLDEAGFENTPLAEICSSISLYYNVSFVTNDVDLNRNFTGRYRKTSLDTALLMVFEPMGISAKHEGNAVILKNK